MSKSMFKLVVETDGLYAHLNRCGQNKEETLKLLETCIEEGWFFKQAGGCKEQPRHLMIHNPGKNCKIRIFANSVKNRHWLIDWIGCGAENQNKDRYVKPNDVDLQFPDKTSSLYFTPLQESRYK